MTERLIEIEGKTFGIVLRTYASKPEDVLKRVKAVRDFVARACDICYDGDPVFSRIDVMVWENKRYPDADCGQTGMALVDAKIQDEFSPIVEVHSIREGDIFCGILNEGVALQLGLSGVDYTLIASTEAVSYLNDETVAEMISAVSDERVRVVGVALNELAESVLAGRVSNTMALWHTFSLMSVGGFDLRAAKPVNEQSAHYLKGADSRGAPVFYQLAGVEEILPLARLVDVYGQCIAPILPRGSGVKHYQVPDPVTQPELYARHIAKLATKYERQVALAASAGYDLSHLKAGVLPGYGKK